MADVLFINTNETLELRYETNGTLILATKLLQAGISTNVLRFCEMESFLKPDHYHQFIDDMVDRILQFHPKCVSFYTLWPYYHVILRIAKILKARSPEIYTILGGPQASATAEDTLRAAPYIDYICTGEGENTVVPFFQMLLNQDRPVSSIPALYYRENGQIVHNELDFPLCDLETLPHWDDRLFTYDENPKKRASDTYFMPIDVGRGCPFSCTFCSSSRFWKRAYRLKSAEQIVSEIEYYMQKYGIRSFRFSHDAFTVNKRLTTAVCDAIIEKKLDINWITTTRVDCISEELIQKMKQAGLTNIELGIESGSARMQKIINKRLDLNRVKEMAQYLLENKIRTHLYFMYGFPDETEQDLNETLDMCFSLYDFGVPRCSMSYCRFNPNTEITAQHLQDLVLDPNCQILAQDIYGYEEELDVIRNNKPLFPFMYHLNTPTRNNYQYLTQLNRLYSQFRRTLGYLRSIYHGNNLQFYHDFISSNSELFSRKIDSISDAVIHNPLPIIENMINKTDLSSIPQLKELLRYENDIYHLRREQEDCTVRKTYGFSYLDLNRKLPITKYHQAETDILFQKTGNYIKTKIVGLR